MENETWYPSSTAPSGIHVMTKIDDEKGCRNEAILKRGGNLWFSGDMYMYYRPTHWRSLFDHERMEMKNEPEAKAIRMLKEAREL